MEKSSKKRKNKSTLKDKKKKIGRPSRYNPIYHPKIVELLTRIGKTDKEVSKEIGISEVTLNDWKKKHPEFLKSLKKGKKYPDDKVVASLFQRATGYSHPEDKIFCNAQGKVTIVKTIKHYPPDTGAICFWLKNRRPKEWKERQELEVKGEVVNIIKGVFSKKDKKIKGEDKDKE